MPACFIKIVFNLSSLAITKQKINQDTRTQEFSISTLHWRILLPGRRAGVLSGSASSTHWLPAILCTFIAGLAHNMGRVWLLLWLRMCGACLLMLHLTTCGTYVLSHQSLSSLEISAGSFSNGSDARQIHVRHHRFP